MYTRKVSYLSQLSERQFYYEQYGNPDQSLCRRRFRKKTKKMLRRGEHHHDIPTRVSGPKEQNWILDSLSPGHPTTDGARVQMK